MNKVFGILLGLITLAYSPSWATTFKDGKIAPEYIIEEPKENLTPDENVSATESSFWSKTDEFLGKIADGISKKDTITGLRTLDSPFHNEEDYRRRGAETLNLILDKAHKDGVKVFSFDDPEYQRVQRIVDRLIDASHYKNHKHKVKYEVIDYEDFNALAFGGGYFVVFTGLMKQTNDDELAYVIAHELAHNTAGHIEESFFLRVKDVFGDKPTGAYTTSFKNIHEQEADRIAIVYTALAGFDPRASATIWEKQYQGIEQYAFYRSHPANPQRVQANRYAANLVMKHFTRGVVHPNVEKVLKCNELFCNTSMSEIAEDGSGGGVLKTLEVLGDYYIKNKQAKEEKKRQAQEIAKAQQLLAKKRLETPPKINWDGTVAYRYEGKINRHNQISGNSFGFSRDLSQGKFAYNFNNQLVVGNLVLHSTNKDGYWFRWNDKWGQGFVLLQEYTDGSMRGNIYLDDGTNPGKLMGQFGGFRK
jgi:Zn-dependent protease with chaperone function